MYNQSSYLTPSNRQTQSSRSPSPRRSPSPTIDRIKKPKNPFIEIQNFICKQFILHHLASLPDKTIRTLLSDSVNLFISLKDFTTPSLFNQAKEEVLNDLGLDTFKQINNNSKVWLSFTQDAETIYTCFHQTLGNLPKTHLIERLDKIWNETRIERKRNGIKNAIQRLPSLLDPNDPTDPLVSTSYNPIPVNGDGEIYLKNPRFLNPDEKPVVDRWDNRISSRSVSPQPLNSTFQNPTSQNPAAQLFGKSLLPSEDALSQKLKNSSLNDLQLMEIIQQLQQENFRLGNLNKQLEIKVTSLEAELKLLRQPQQPTNVKLNLKIDSIQPSLVMESPIVGPGMETLKRLHKMLDE